MLTFSINASLTKTVSKMTNVDFTARTVIGREWLGVAFIKASEGKYDGAASVDTYAYSCANKEAMSKGKSKEVALLESDEVNDGQKGVASNVARYIDENIDTLIDRSEYKYCVEQFLDMQEYILLEEGTSLYRVLSLAYNGKVKAMQRLKELSEKYSLTSIIETIIRNVDCFLVLKTAFDNEKGVVC